jgi:FkbM family methyltransferase
MIGTLNKIQYQLGKYVFEHFGIPKIKDEKISKAYIKKFLPNNPVMIDCGANDGSDSIELALRCGGEVHAFEPLENIFNQLKIKTANYAAIHCYQLALSDCDGTGSFYVSEGGSEASSSMLEPKEHLTDHPDVLFNQRVPVPMLTLDSWAKKNSIKKIDLLWLDMQGFEMNMLQAAGDILNTVTVIHTEVSTKETYKGVVQYTAYRHYLESLGFKVIVEAIPAGWDMGNVLFVRK